MLTVRMLEPTVRDIEWIRKTNAPVGCDPDSFVGNYLTDVLKLKNIKNISLQSEYPDNFKNGTISAAFLELPYEKYFLKEYCNEYTSVGPSYKFGGLGFVFPKDSPITNDVSGAILYLMEEGKIRELENQWLNTSQTCSNSNPRLEYLEEAIQPKVVHRYIKVVFQAFAAGMRMAKACALAYLAALSKSSSCIMKDSVTPGNMYHNIFNFHPVICSISNFRRHVMLLRLSDSNCDKTGWTMRLHCFSRHQSSLDMGDNISGKGMTQDARVKKISLEAAKGIGHIHSEGGPKFSHGYNAPEVIENRKFTHKSDVYSFGVLLLEIVTGKAPLPALGQEEVVDLPR
ncbi:glutamate receptor 2.7-like protein [Tanacetum coccineum]